MSAWPPELHPDAYRQPVEGTPAILYIDRQVLECWMPLNVSGPAS